MATMTIEPLRWVEEPSRVTICQNGERLRSFYQVTAPRRISEMCNGRPVEELPRILSILSPSHHTASAIALDNLFGVTPPPLAQAVREALEQSHIFVHHLRKLFYLVSFVENPLAPPLRPGPRTGHPSLPHHLFNEIMHGMGLAQEAASILGGRCDHPLTSVAGGVSRPLKKSHCNRLSEIAESCLSYALHLYEVLNAWVIGPGSPLGELASLSLRPMASVALNGMDGAVVLTDPSGTETTRFSPDEVRDALETSFESWTYLPFVHLKGKSWQGIECDGTEGIYFVGPLARRNQTKPLETSHAEEKRQHIISSFGPFPHFSVTAAYCSLLLELIQAAEKMKELYSEQHLTGSEIRSIPSSPGQTGRAVFEGPEGFIYHRYEVDGRGIVENVTILDAAAQNNALRCLLAHSIVELAAAGGHSWDDTKRTIELSLVPF